MNWKPPQIEHPPTPERCQPSIDLVQDLRMDAEMLKDGHQENLTKLWHSDVVKNAAANALLAADQIASLKADNERLRKALEDAHADLIGLAADCHRSKWEFDLSEDFKPTAKYARTLILKAFDELHRIGDRAIRAKDAALPQSSGVARAEK